MISPQVASLQAALPPVAFGVMALSGAVATLLLPNTHNKPTLESLTSAPAAFWKSDSKDESAQASNTALTTTEDEVNLLTQALLANEFNPTKQTAVSQT